MGTQTSKHGRSRCRRRSIRRADWAHRLPVRHHLQRDLLRSRLHDGVHCLLLPASRQHDRALQGGPVLHWARDLRRLLPLLPHLQLLRCRLHPMRGRRGCRQPNKCSPELGYSPTGHAFNDAYRYMDWLLTVPLLLIEIVLVMKLSPEETKKQSLRLGVRSGLMILNGYPGESSGDASTRWTYWTLST